MTAFPFVYGRFTKAWDGGQAIHYPGLGTAWQAAVRQGGEFQFEKGTVVLSGTPPTALSAGAWTVVFDPKTEMKSSPDHPYLKFAGERVIVECGNYHVDGPARVFEGLKASELKLLSDDREKFASFVRGSLFALATAESPGAFTSVIGLMFLQNLLFMSVLGLLLAASGLPIAGSEPGSQRKVGFWASVKTVAAISLGPAFLTALIGLINPDWGVMIGMMAYSLLLGIRVILVYMARFRNKKKLGG